MTHHFDEIHAVIEDLQQAIKKLNLFRDDTLKSNPGWEHLSDEDWDSKLSRCWLHGATELLEANDLERWLFEPTSLSDTAKEGAAKCIKCWKEWLELKNSYYGVFEDFEIEEPKEGEMLRDYILRMASIVEKEGKGARIEWRAMKSFLAYMRKIAHEEIAFIEQIFPQKMDIHYGQIIRIIPAEVYPISQGITGDILRELARLAVHGRPNSRLSALESLGFCWLCLTTSRLRLPTSLTMVENIKASAINLNNDYATLLVPTQFGEKKIKISVRVAKFLIALSKIPFKKPRESILQLPRRTLSRTLDRAVLNVVNQDLGNITYFTMLSTPHIFERDYRYKPK